MGGLKYLSLCGVQQNIITGALVQWVGRLIADPGVVGSIWSQSHTFVEIDYGIFSTVILLLLLIQEGSVFADYLVSVTSDSMRTKYWLITSQAFPGKSVVRLTDHLT